VNRLMSRARGFLVALAVLALSAGIALAGRPATAPAAAAAGGLERASNASGKTLPVAAPDADAPAADEDADESADENEPAESEVDTDAAVHPDNHGKVVSEAAQGETPEGFDNHGQYVKTIATDNSGQSTAAEHASPKAKPVH